MYHNKKVKCNLKSINYNFPKDFFQDTGADESSRRSRLASLEIKNQSHTDIPNYGLNIKLNLGKNIKGIDGNSRYLCIKGKFHTVTSLYFTSNFTTASEY
jgi:hypothetical protein